MTKDEQIVRLKERIASLEAEKNVYWQPTKRDVGFTINFYGDIRCGFDDAEYLRRASEIGNTFETYDGAEKALNLMKAKAKVKKRVYELNGNCFLPMLKGISIKHTEGGLKCKETDHKYGWLTLITPHLACELIKELPEELKLILKE